MDERSANQPRPTSPHLAHAVTSHKPESRRSCLPPQSDARDWKEFANQTSAGGYESYSFSTVYKGSEGVVVCSHTPIGMPFAEEDVWAWYREEFVPTVCGERADATIESIIAWDPDGETSFRFVDSTLSTIGLFFADVAHSRTRHDLAADDGEGMLMLRIVLNRASEDKEE